MDIYDIVKTILSAICWLSLAVCTITLFYWVVKFISRSKDLKKRKRAAIIFAVSLGIMIVSMFIHFMVAVKQYSRPLDPADIPTIEVTSESITDGFLKKECGAKNGNVSPQLTWEAVDDEGSFGGYQIVMIDHDGRDWLHWAAYIPVGKYVTEDQEKNVTDNLTREGRYYSIAEGAFTGPEAAYVGPYPPSGTHTYTIYIFSLVGESRGIESEFDAAGADFDKVLQNLDSGLYTDYHNVRAIGKIEGKYSAN